MKAIVSLLKSKGFAVCVLIGGLLSSSSVRIQAAQNSTNYVDQITAAKTFKERLIWVGENAPSETESEALWLAMEKTRAKGGAVKMDEFENFLNQHPQSPWAASLRANLAYYYRSIGRYTPALQHWQAAWTTTGALDSGTGKRVGDFTLVNWTQLLSSLGRVDELEQLFATVKDRQMQELDWQQTWIRVHNALGLMKRQPGVAYRCGTFALANIAEVYTNSAAAAALEKLPSPDTGFALSTLMDLAEQHHLGLTAKRRVSGTELVVPSVVHWRQNHYAAIVGQHGDLYVVTDATFGRSRLMTGGAINSEASGVFLVPAGENLPGWEAISKTEAESIHGKGLDTTDPLPPPPPCPDPSQRNPDCFTNTPSCGCDTNGMPAWYVTEPYISLWLKDSPMSYRTSTGEEFPLKLFYHQRETRPVLTNVFNLGPDWNCTWLSYIDVENNDNEQSDTNFTHFQAYLYGAGGGVMRYAAEFYVTNGVCVNRGFVWWADGTDMTPDSRYHTTLKRTTVLNSGVETLVGFKQTYPNGSQAIYNLLHKVSDYPEEVQAFLTARIDPEGKVTVYTYTTNNDTVHLTQVTDWDGNPNSIYYDSTFTNQISEFHNPYGGVVKVHYDSNGLLTNIEDVVGLKSSFQYAYYSGIPAMTNLGTPYGNTSFSHFRPTEGLFGNTDDDDINRALTVTQPDGGKHLFMYRDFSQTLTRGGNPINFLDITYSDGPGLPELCNINMYYRNSFYWGPRQFALLSTGTITQLSTNDYNLARLRNWLHQGLRTGGDLAVAPTLNIERLPSLDGISGAQKVWYGYSGKGASDNIEGTNAKPSYVARGLPNGQVQYKHDLYNPLGHPTSSADTYSDGQSVRTSTYEFAADGIDVLRVIGPDGVTNAAYVYNTNHQVLFVTNALSEVTRFNYRTFANSVSTNSQVASVTYPSGLVTTNIYDSNGFLTITYDYAVVGGSTVYYRTNSYTYSNGQTLSRTDERGLALTNTWDALERLTKVSFPDGSALNYTYSNLDLVRVVDRMGFTNSYAYDNMRRRTNWVSALGYVTVYNYCACGTLDSIRDAAGNYTYFYYDTQGRKIATVYPDGYALTNNYDALGQITSVIDSAGVSVTNWFNNQGLLIAASNAIGQVVACDYDLYDRVITNVDVNGVSIVTIYDDLGRTQARIYPDGGMDVFGYTLNVSGPTSYTSQLNRVTYYAYDPLGRKTAETNSNGEITQFTYSPAGDVLTLIDGKNQATTWKYDTFGRVTNKMDNLGTNLFFYTYDLDDRLTNRTSAAKGSTVFKYDAVGNVTNVVYPVSPAITLKYDTLNRLTNMVDIVGTTRFTYDAASQLLSEDGPWTDDTVSYTYQNRLRSSMSVSAPNASAWNQFYGYDSIRRLTSITSPSGNFSYQYVGSGPSTLISRLSLPNGAYITNEFDENTRLLSTVLKSSQDSILNSHQYAYDAGNQRTQQVFTAGNYIDYTYDPIGQLKSASGKDNASGNTTNRLQEQFGYAYDAAGNLNFRTNNALVHTFIVNSLNELSNITRSGTLTVAGATTSPSTNVTINTLAAMLYTDNTFARSNFTLANGNNTFTAVAKDGYGRQDSQSITVNLPATNSYTYDLNGNLLSDGTRNFAYDDENELTSVWVTNAWRSDFAYDGELRRRTRKEYAWQSNVWTVTNEVHYVYDGKLVIQERDSNNLPQVAYARGKDMSGSSEGAGGIGGLLARTDFSTFSTQPSTAHAYYHADGNGNITCLINSNQLVVARYEYGPFGNILSMSGPVAGANLFRFSSEEFHVASGLIYYLYRFYDPSLQRWPNRDPIHEKGGRNLYGFVGNNPLIRVDLLGWCKIQLRCGPTKTPGTPIPVGVHCGIIADQNEYTIMPDNQGVGGGASVFVPGGVPKKQQFWMPRDPEPGFSDYPITCCNSCDDTKKKIQDYHESVTPPPYSAAGANSNTFAHRMLDAIGCKVNPIPVPCYILNDTILGMSISVPVLVCPPPTTSPPGAGGWDYGYH